MIHTDPLEQPIALLTLLQHVHTYGLSIQANDAREHAHTVSEAASRGFISTQVVAGCNRVYGRTWKITLAGLELLTRCSSIIEDQELAAYARRVSPSVTQVA